MVYRRPKQIRTNYTNDITGPWLDPQYTTDSVQDSGQLSLDGDEDSILKNSLVAFWDDLTIDYVGHADLK